MKKKYRIRWGRVFIALLTMSILTFSIIMGVKALSDTSKVIKSPKLEINYTENNEKEVDISEEEEFCDENKENNEKNVVIDEKAEPQTQYVTVEPVQDTKNYIKYRMTSFWTGDEYGSVAITGSGKSSNDFQINENGWYTYNGKIVIAAATNACLNSHSGACGKWNNPINGRKYFNYYDEISLNIDGIEYIGIVLDSCGACMYVENEERIDLFVSDGQYAIDRGYKGNNPVILSY